MEDEAHIRVQEKEVKLLIVGLDGADYQLCEKFTEVMPNLVAIKTNGSFGLLQSLEFPSTPTCWFSIITGCTPEEHRIQGFRTRAMQDVRREPFWKYLDCPVGIVNIPLVYAYGEHDGFIVPGFHAPWRPHPPDLEMINGYRVEAGLMTEGRLTWLSEKQDLTDKQIKRRQLSFMRLQEEVETKRVDAVEDLLARFNVDVLFVGIVMLDRMGHAFAHHYWTMRDAHKHVDRLLGRLVDITEPENIVVFSDHGMDVSDSPRIPRSVIENEEKRLAKSDLKVKPKGLHTRDGIFAACGVDVLRGVSGDGLLVDVAPTILSMLDVEKPDGMSGNVMDIFWREGDFQLLETLKGLGYV